MCLVPVGCHLSSAPADSQNTASTLLLWFALQWGRRGRCAFAITIAHLMWHPSVGSGYRREERLGGKVRSWLRPQGAGYGSSERNPPCGVFLVSAADLKSAPPYRATPLAAAILRTWLSSVHALRNWLSRQLLVAQIALPAPLAPYQSLARLRGFWRHPRGSEGMATGMRAHPPPFGAAATAPPVGAMSVHNAAPMCLYTHYSALLCHVFDSATPLSLLPSWFPPCFPILVSMYRAF
jgi:hypothetical protein